MPPDAGGAAVQPKGRGPLHNVGWMLASFFNGTMWTNQVLLNVVIPLWLVQATDAPHWLLAWLFGTNTVLCIFLPAYTSRGVETISDALRSVRISGAFFVASCLITMATHSTAGFLTIFLVWLGHVAVTGAELYISGASWAFQAKLMDPARRGEYGGVAEVFSTLGGRWAPAALHLLAMSWHPAGAARRRLAGDRRHRGRGRGRDAPVGPDGRAVPRARGHRRPRAADRRTRDRGGALPHLTVLRQVGMLEPWSSS